ncbi:hypothetical protein ACKAV7_012285 [Fusarium commune]
MHKWALKKDDGGELSQAIPKARGYLQTSPPRLSFLPELFNNEIDDQEVGESGRYWEGVVLGGTVETYENTSNPLGSRQAGDLFLFDSQMRARKLDRAYIRRNLEFNFDFPLRTVGRSVHIDDLDDQRRPMMGARAASLPRGVSLDRDRARTVKPAQLEFYASLPSHTVSGREFELIRRIPRMPAYLFAAA